MAGGDTQESTLGERRGTECNQIWDVNLKFAHVLNLDRVRNSKLVSQARCQADLPAPCLRNDRPNLQFPTARQASCKTSRRPCHLSSRWPSPPCIDTTTSLQAANAGRCGLCEASGEKQQKNKPMVSDMQETQARSANPLQLPCFRSLTNFAWTSKRRDAV